MTRMVTQTRAERSSYSGSEMDWFATETSTNTFSNSEHHWWIGRVLTTSVLHERAESVEEVRNSEFRYSKSNGMLLEEIIEPDDPQYEVVTSYELDGFGNRVVTTITGIGMTPRQAFVEYENLGRTVIRHKNAYEPTDPVHQQVGCVRECALLFGYFKCPDQPTRGSRWAGSMPGHLQ